MRLKSVMWNDKMQYEIRSRKIVFDAFFRPKAHKMWMVSNFDHATSKFHNVDAMIDALRNRKFIVNAVIRRDEHAHLYGATDEWKKMIDYCHGNNILPMHYDFGYFDHYNNYMVDIYDENGKSGIIKDWSNVSDKLDWDSAPDHIKEYRNNFLEQLNIAKSNDPIDNLESGKYVVIWQQSTLKLLRPEFNDILTTDGTAIDVANWINKIVKLVSDMGLTPVVKGEPNIEHWRTLDVNHIQHAPIYVNSKSHLSLGPSARFVRDVNPKLIAHAKFHITCCSSVTNELVMAGAPVITMGKSWFNGLGVFNEPNGWDQLFKDATEINHTNRNKWINWWLSRQAHADKITRKISEVYEKYKGA